MEDNSGGAFIDPIEKKPFGIGPQTGFIQGLATSFASAIEETPVPQLFRIGQAEFFPGPHLSQEEWENGDLFRKGINVGKDGIDTHMATILARRHDAKQGQQDILNDMKPGFASGFAQFVGGNIGLVLGNLPVFELFPEIAASTSAYIGTNIWRTESVLARFGRRAIGGAVAGGVTIAPNEFTKFGAENFFEQNTSIIEPLIGIGMGAAFGGAIHGIFGRTRVITPRSNNLAKETSVNQLIMGKSVDIEPIIKNGYKDATEAQAAKLQDIQQQTPELIPQIDAAQQAERNRLEAQQANLDEPISKAQGKVDELSNKPLVKTIRDRGPTLIDKINEGLRTIESKRTKAQKFVLNNENHLDEVQRATKLRNTDESFRTPEQSDFMNRFNNPIGEKALVEERLQTNRNQQELLRKAVQEPNLSDATKGNIVTQLNRANHQVMMAENRIAELNQVPSFSNALKAAHVKLFNLRNERNLVRDRLNENKLHLKMQELPPKPVELSDLKNTVDQIDSPEGDLSFDRIAQDRLDNEMETLQGSDEEIFNRQAEEAFQRVKDMDDKGLLKGVAEQDLFEAAQARESDNNILIKGFKEMTNCLIGSEK